MTTHRPHDNEQGDEQPTPTTTELHLAWQRAKALWSSAPDDRDAYTAFIHAGTALYRHRRLPRPAPDSPLLAGALGEPR